MSVEKYLTTDLNKPTNLPLYAFTSFLNSTPLEGLSDTFVQAERKHSVNAVYLLAHAIHESDFGRSRIAQDKKNLFGFGAYDRNPYENALEFDSYEHCIDYVAGYIKRNYLTKGGRYYNGPTLKGVNVRYATDPKWAEKIAKWMDIVYKNVKMNDYENHWAEAEIKQAIQLKIVAGHTDGTVRPDEPMTRAEAIVIVIRAVNFIIKCINDAMSLIVTKLKGDD